MNAFSQHLIDQYGYQVSGSERLGNQLLVESNTSESGKLKLIPISQQSILQCQGPEAAKFLQGQLTCDVQTVTQSQSQFGAHCTPKGRVLSSFRLAQLNDETYLMGCHHSVQEIILKQLGKYIVFSKATLAEPETPWACIGLVGEDAASNLEKLGFQPEQHTSSNGSSLCIQLDQSQHSYEIWAELDNAIALWDQLAEDALLASSDQWDLALIEAGVAQVQEASSDEFVAQMLNFDAIDAISFTKGCYTGQEIIARAKYRGQVKRRMIRAQAKLPSESSPVARVGDTILLDEKDVGTVVLAAKASDNTYQLLAVVKGSVIEDDAINPASLTVATSKPSSDECDTETQKVQVLTLPYAIPK